jgi:hypothetical protein
MSDGPNSAIDQLAPSHLDGTYIAQLSARLRCAECGGPLHSVKPRRLEDVLGKPLGRKDDMRWLGWVLD